MPFKIYTKNVSLAIFANSIANWTVFKTFSSPFEIIIHMTVLPRFPIPNFMDFVGQYIVQFLI